MTDQNLKTESELTEKGKKTLNHFRNYYNTMK